MSPTNGQWNGRDFKSMDNNYIKNAYYKARVMNTVYPGQRWGKSSDELKREARKRGISI